MAMTTMRTTTNDDDDDEEDSAVQDMQVNYMAGKIYAILVYAENCTTTRRESGARARIRATGRTTVRRDEERTTSAHYLARNKEHVGKGRDDTKVASRCESDMCVCVCRLYVCLCVCVAFGIQGVCIVYMKILKIYNSLVCASLLFLFSSLSLSHSLSLFLCLVCFACSLYKSQLFIIFVVLVYCTFSFAFAFIFFG